MNKAFLIFTREYLAKVKNKTFLVATLLGPIFFLGIIVVPIWLDHETNQEVSIGVIDENKVLLPLLKSDRQIRFVATEPQSVNDLQTGRSGNYENLLMIPDTLDVFKSSGITLYFSDNKGGKLEGQVKDRINKALITRRFSRTGISQNKVDSLRAEPRIKTIVMDETGGGAADTTATSVVGMLFGLLTYMFIFLYGSQVMRSVIEEKTSRIVEIIITSVKPFQLLMGKILAVGAVGLTQFVIWVVAVNILSAAFGINPGAANRRGGGGLAETSIVKVEAPREENEKSFKTSEKTAALLRKLPATIGWFLLFFVGGYLLYSSMFAAIGSAVDQDGGETQQFMLPVTVPLIISIAVSSAVINNPQAPMAFWMSMIPFTSPIIMMMRIPFGVPAWQILLSLGILFATFALMLYFSAKIYRIGIISYGKRFTFKDLLNWMRQA